MMEYERTSNNFGRSKLIILCKSTLIERNSKFLIAIHLIKQLNPSNKTKIDYVVEHANVMKNLRNKIIKNVSILLDQ